jgi:hypothetical protein
MTKRRRKLIAWTCGIVVVLLLSAAFLPLWVFRSSFAIGKGIDRLPEKEQIAYLALTAELNEYFERPRSVDEISIAIDDQDRCEPPSAALREALSRLPIVGDRTIVAADCRLAHFFFSPHEDGYMAGSTCGKFELCGGGHLYEMRRPFGIIVVVQTASWIS